MVLGRRRLDVKQKRCTNITFDGRCTCVSNTWFYKIFLLLLPWRESKNSRKIEFRISTTNIANRMFWKMVGNSPKTIVIRDYMNNQQEFECITRECKSELGAHEAVRLGHFRSLLNDIHSHDFRVITLFA